jgi:hypothetical protein
MRLQRKAAAKPVPQRGNAPLANFRCFQGCGCLIIALVGLMFFSALSRSCTRSTNAAAANTEMRYPPSTSYAPPNLSGGNAGTPLRVRRALHVSDATLSLFPYQASPANAAVSQGMYSVAGVARYDLLNVDNGPGSNYEVVAKLPNGCQGVQVVGSSMMNGTTEWVQIKFKN